MNYTKPFELSRRHMLRGVGATMALPFLEAMTGTSQSVFAVGPNGQPIRFAALFMPNGVDHSRFTPKGRSLNDLPSSLQPLAALINHVNIVTGLNNAGSGHAAGTASFLTGQDPKKTPKANAVNVYNPSLDQMIGQAAEKSCVLPTLELGMHTPRSGVSMSGHSQLYGSFISWKNPTTPVPHEINPLRAFERLFKGASVTSTGGGHHQSSLAPTKSVIDTILLDAKSLQKRLGRSDQQKLDEYLTTVREVETRILNRSKASRGLTITTDVFADIKDTKGRIRKAMRDSEGNSLSAAPNIPYQEYGQIMMDIMALALWSNSSRAATLMFGDGLNGRNMSFLDGIDGNHHSISHHGNKKEGLRKFSIINTYFVSQYAYLLNRLASMKEGNSSVLENSVVLMGTNLSSGQVHSGKNVPMLVGGNAGGKLKGNTHIKAEGKPVVSVHRSVLDLMNLKDQFKGKGGKLRGLG